MKRVAYNKYTNSTNGHTYVPVPLKHLSSLGGSVPCVHCNLPIVGIGYLVCTLDGCLCKNCLKHWLDYPYFFEEYSFLERDLHDGWYLYAIGQLHNYHIKLLRRQYRREKFITKSI